MQAHRSECGRCSGRRPDWPCSQSEEYEEFRNRVLKAGLPNLVLEQRNTFASFRHERGSEDALAATEVWATLQAGWIVLTGDVGTGKTHLAMAAVENIVAGGRMARFWTVAGLLENLRSLYDRDGIEDQGWDYWPHLYSALPLVLDDLGAEKPTEWAVEHLTLLLDRRYRERLPTLITTNLGEREMAAKLGKRISDRVFDIGTGLVKVCLLECGSYRRGKADA